jgi:hypothetical protein
MRPSHSAARLCHNRLASSRNQSRSVTLSCQRQQSHRHSSVLSLACQAQRLSRLQAALVRDLPCHLSAQHHMRCRWRLLCLPAQRHRQPRRGLQGCQQYKQTHPAACSTRSGLRLPRRRSQHLPLLPLPHRKPASRALRGWCSRRRTRWSPTHARRAASRPRHRPSQPRLRDMPMTHGRSRLQQASRTVARQRCRGWGRLAVPRTTARQRKERLGYCLTACRRTPSCHRFPQWLLCWRSTTVTGTLRTPARVLSCLSPLRRWQLCLRHQRIPWPPRQPRGLNRPSRPEAQRTPTECCPTVTSRPASKRTRTRPRARSLLRLCQQRVAFSLRLLGTWWLGPPAARTGAALGRLPCCLATRAAEPVRRSRKLGQGLRQRRLGRRGATLGTRRAGRQVERRLQLPSLRPVRLAARAVEPRLTRPVSARMGRTGLCSPLRCPRRSRHRPRRPSEVHALRGFWEARRRTARTPRQPHRRLRSGPRAPRSLRRRPPRPPAPQRTAHHPPAAQQQ